MHKNRNIIERTIETLLYSSRWSLVPIYLGLSLMILAIGFAFYQELFHYVLAIIDGKEVELVLVILSLVDLALIGGLLVMVMFSGYESFVSHIQIDENKEKLNWLGKLDMGALKVKIAMTIVAISSIHLLKTFMEAEKISDNKLMWYVIIHLTFVISALGVCLVDRISKK